MMDVQTAVDVLSDTSPEILENSVGHDELEKLTKLLNVVLNRTKAANRPAHLLEAIQKTLPDLWTFTTSEAGESCLQRDRPEQDERVTDIKIIEGKKQPTVEERLCRGAAQRSLAKTIYRMSKS